MKVKVAKLSKNENTFKSDLDKLDYIHEPPKAGSSLMIFSTEHSGHAIHTSIIEEVDQHPWGWYVKTLNSEYEIKLLEMKVRSNTQVG